MRGFENVFLAATLELSFNLCSLFTRLAIGLQSLIMLINNLLSPQRVLRYGLAYFVISVIGAQAGSCDTNLIVDTDIFSDVEYVRPFASSRIVNKL